uniref:Histone H2A n=1 Tax=Anolis carolinensis TaxID=28377 RepID=A0A803TQE9_ANOCA
GRDSTSRDSKTKSTLADLQFSVGRVAQYLKQGNYAKRIGVGASVYLTAVLEYLTTEILELQSIAPRHIQLGVRNDNELNKLFAHVTIAEGGVLPNIRAELVPKMTALSAAPQSQPRL